MKTIHKYVVIETVNDVVTHQGARFLTADNQHEEITIWAEVDTAQPKTVRSVHVVGTGGEVPDAHEYVGTAMLAGGRLVFHVYAQPAVRPKVLIG